MHSAQHSNVFETDSDYGLMQHIILEQDLNIKVQPIVDLKSRKVLGYEALARGPKGTALESAKSLFDTAAEYNLKDELDYSALIAALDIQHALDKEHFISINLGTNLFLSSLFNEITNLCAHIAQHIIFELTDQIRFTELSHVKEKINKLHNMGYRIALNNTHCAFSDLEQARLLAPTYVKMRCTSIEEIAESPTALEKFHLINSHLRESSTLVLAEGIETQAQLDKALQLEISAGQGFLFGKPTRL